MLQKFRLLKNLERKNQQAGVDLSCLDNRPEDSKSSLSEAKSSTELKANTDEHSKLKLVKKMLKKCVDDNDGFFNSSAAFCQLDDIMKKQNPGAYVNQLEQLQRAQALKKEK